MKDIKSNEQSLSSIHDPQGVKLLSRLRLNFSHLNEHKFHKFRLTLKREIESTQHFFLRCHFYHVERSELRNSLYDIDLAMNELSEDCVINLDLFGSDKHYKETNRKIILNRITYLKATKRFAELLL